MILLLWGLMSPSFPTTPELCNGVDDDGDGVVDEGPVAWSVDVDGDGGGDAERLVLTAGCDLVPPGGLPDVSDCDDARPEISPGSGELCNGVDDDCDGQIDEVGCSCDVARLSTSTLQICTEYSDWLEAAWRCEESGYHLATIDSESLQIEIFQQIAPYGRDLWIGLSDLEHGGLFWWIDGTYGGYQHWGWREPSYDSNENCVVIQPNGRWGDVPCWLEQASLCEAECAVRRWFVDGDGDGLGDPEQQVWACSPDEGWVANNADCDDTDATLPDLFYVDRDGDGFGVTGDAVVACAGPSRRAGDCDDENEQIHPGAEEIGGDGVDQDCDGEDPGGDPTSATSATSDGHPPPPQPRSGFGLGCSSAPVASWGLLWIGLCARRRRSA